MRIESRSQFFDFRDTMDIKDAILKRRSIRRFKRDKVKREIIVDLADYGRLAPSTINLQPLEFLVVDEDGAVDKMFSAIKLGGLLPEDQKPKFEERPQAYIIILANTDIMKSMYERDVGASAENILLGAVAHGLGGVLIWSIDRDKIRDFFTIPENYAIDCAVALGHPAEVIKVIEAKEDVRYYRDDDSIHVVPKRPLKGMLHLNKF